MPKNLCFLDLETTGLDPKWDEVLEVGVVIYDPRNLEEVAAQNWVFHFDLGPEAPISPPERVVEMHTVNGLWDECRASIKKLYTSSDEIAAFIKDNEAGGSYLCGNSVHFDRSFLLRPGGYSILDTLHSHRHLDVSTLNVVSDIWPNLLLRAPRGDAHRALPDCRDSIAQLEHYLNQLAL
jgi:oligoribonuclease